MPGEASGAGLKVPPMPVTLEGVRLDHESAVFMRVTSSLSWDWGIWEMGLEMAGGGDFLRNLPHLVGFQHGSFPPQLRDLRFEALDFSLTTSPFCHL